jgi:hypothetical protein
LRPISLLGSANEFIAKVLANQSKKLLGKIFLDSQNVYNIGFSKSIEEVIGEVIWALVLIECLDSRLKPKILVLLCKLDLVMA